MKTETLHEIVQSHDLKIDPDAGVITGVRILGPRSVNNRRYLPEAIRKAMPLYEGIQVNYNHPPRNQPNADRTIDDRAGWLKNVHEVEGGLSGDLHLLKEDVRAPKIFECAERNARLLGLSHNAEGKTRRENGTTLVEEITDVRSVDLVSDPASTKSLFEQKEHKMQKNVLELLREACTTPNRKAMLREIEGEELVPPEAVAEMPEEEPAPDAGEQIKVALNTAAKAAIDDDALGPVETAQKVKEIMIAKEKLVADKAPEKKEKKSEEPAAESKQFKVLVAGMANITEQLTELKGRVGVEKPAGGMRLTEQKNDAKKTEDNKQFCEAVFARSFS